jgi:hypothetical protein
MRLARLAAAGFAWFGVGAGCGDETRCPDGLEGTPCRYVEAPRTPPVVPPISVVSDALAGDTSGADADATTNDGLSSDGSGDAGPDAEPDDVRQDGEADVGAHIETPNAHAVARFAFASGDGPSRRQIPSLSPCRPATAAARESGVTLAWPFPSPGSAV